MRFHISDVQLVFYKINMEVSDKDLHKILFALDCEDTIKQVTFEDVVVRLKCKFRIIVNNAEQSVIKRSLDSFKLIKKRKYTI